MKHKVTEITLPNKAKGLLVNIPDASVMSFLISFRAGEYLVDIDHWEVPHLMEHVLLGANKIYPRTRDFQAEFEKNGAYNNASTSVYDITYEAECADFEWDRILGLLLLAITEPLFLEDEFKAEFGNVRDELTSRSNNHFRHLSLAMREAYGLNAKTDQERLKLMRNVKLKNVQNHYRQTHTTNNLRFVIGGNLDADREKSIVKMFSELNLPNGHDRKPLPIEKPHSLEDPLYIRNHSVENIYFYIDTFMQRRLTDPEIDSLDLLNIMLTETLYSKILGTARERGLIYGMSSGRAQLNVVSNWWFGAQVIPTNAEPLFDIMKDELMKVFNGDLAGEDIAAAQGYALGRFQRSAQTVGGIVGGYAGRYFFDDVIEDYYLIPDRIKAVTKAGLIEIAQAMFRDNIWGFGVLGNCGIDIVRDLQAQLLPLWSNSGK